MQPAQITPGETLNWRGVRVKVINVDGRTAMIRLETGDWRQCPLAELSPVDITGGTSVGSGAVKVAAVDESSLSYLAGPFGKVVERGVIDEGAIRKRASDAAAAATLRKGQVRLLVDEPPLTRGMIGTLVADEGDFGDRVRVNFGWPGPEIRALVRKSWLEGFSAAASNVQREPMRAGGLLIHKASLSEVRLLSAAPESDLFVVQLRSGEFEVLKGAELLTTDRQPLAPLASDMRKTDSGGLIGLCEQISGQIRQEGGGTLQKRASTTAFKKGQQVRLKRDWNTLPAGTIGTVESPGDPETGVNYTCGIACLGYSLVNNSYLEAV